MKHNLLKTLVALLAIAFAGQANAMEIYVHYTNGTWPSGTTSLNGSGNLILEMEASDSFENLKAKIEDKSGLTPDFITLSYGTYDNLPNDGTLNNYGITSGTTLNMSYNPPTRTVRFAEGTEEADNWTLAVGNRSVNGTRVLNDVVAGDSLVTTYAGIRKVKRVKAVKWINPVTVPLTVEAQTACSLYVNNPKAGMKYSLNGGAKQEISGSPWLITLEAGDKVQLYGNRTLKYSGTSITGANGEMKVYGNIMSLVNEENFETITALTDNSAFYRLFYNNSALKDASGLKLPATTLKNYCYQQMFMGCANLTKAPAELPATTMTNSCYSQMFRDCASLTKAPKILATTMANSCCMSMFQGCSALTTAPDTLYATTLAGMCYYGMFSGCTSLTTAPVLLAATMAENSCTQMFSGCTALTAAPELNATTLADGCYSSMFYGDTSITVLPALTATVLAPGCYGGMFAGCTGITEVPVLPLTTLTEGCYGSMFSGCTGITSIPDGMLPATTLASSCYANMFSGCTGLTTLPDNMLSATELANNCYDQMFQNCTNLTHAPVLPADSLPQRCYNQMFNGCSKLDTITCLATNVSAYQCTFRWLNNTAPAGIFITPADTRWTTGLDGIPYGWKRLNPDLTSYITLGTPLTVEATRSGQVKVTSPKSGMQYSLNGGEKQTLSGTTTIDVVAGDKVAFYGNGTSITSYNGTTIGGAGDLDCIVYGNIMSLVDENGYDNATTLTGSNNFAYLFNANTYIKDARSLLLPATSLASGCYKGMFTGCAYMPTAPELPATNLAGSCYEEMFQNCKSLAVAPELPATNLAYGCYKSMFTGDTSLTAIPELPATSLDPYCYQRMFYGCHGLTTLPAGALPATNLNEFCYREMFLNCKGLTTVSADLLPVTSLRKCCYQMMFQGCSALTTAPDLPATTLANGCYSSMFEGCSSLKIAPALPAETLTESCYNHMFYGCSHLDSVVCLATDISADNCTFHWLEGSGTQADRYRLFVTPDATPWSYNNGGIDNGWTRVSPDGTVQITVNTPFTIEALTAGTIVLNGTKDKMMYSLNGGQKHNISAGIDTTFTVAAGDKVELYGVAQTYDGTTIGGADGLTCRILGNIMSLINSNLQSTNNSFTANNTFKQFFKNNTCITDISGLLLPAITLAQNCYEEMFAGCTGITTAPSLPAELMYKYCYQAMFSGCTNLETAPELPAHPLAESCYQEMFKDCAKLGSVTCLATEGINASNSTKNWLQNAGTQVTGTKTVFTNPNAAANAWPTNSNNGIPAGWTRENAQ